MTRRNRARAPEDYYYTAEPVGECSCHACTCAGCALCEPPDDDEGDR